jgi:squalene synthase HpnC
MGVGHYENFPVASLLVPSRLRPAIVAIYRFARAADDIADEGNDSPAERLAALGRFGDALQAIGRGETPSAAPFPALAEAIRTHGLPLSPFEDLLSAFRQDVTCGRYASYAGLEDYCRRSANPIGRLLLALYRVQTPAAFEASDSICTGLQLVNFWQDVAIDWRKNRLYIPREDLDRFAVTEPEIAAGASGDRWRALMAFETARARALLRSGRPLVRMLPWRLALELSAVVAGGERILERIDAVAGDVFRRRPALGLVDWAFVGIRALRPAPSPAATAA